MKFNKEYKKIIKNIEESDDFSLLKNDVHHGTNKYEHCKRVAYLSFLIAKLFKANCRKVARAGLLHDFFYGSRTSKKENDYVTHPITSSKNAKEVFNINSDECKIIESHMYHYAFFKRLTPFVTEEEKDYLKNYKPNNKESVIVCISDLFVSIFEVITFKVRYNTCLYVIFLLNIMKL